MKDIDGCVQALAAWLSVVGSAPRIRVMGMLLDTGLTRSRSAEVFARALHTGVVEADPGQPLSVRVAPLPAEPDADRGRPRRVASGARLRAPDLCPRSVLLLDAVHDHRRGLIDLVTRRGRHVVHGVADGPEALEWLRSAVALPCAIVFDHRTALTSGADLMRSVRTNCAWSAVPIFILAESPVQESSAARAASLGCRIHPTELLQAIDEVCVDALRRAAHNPSIRVARSAG